MIIGDVDDLPRARSRATRELGVDRLMCLMSFGALPQERVLRSIRLAGEQLIDA